MSGPFETEADARRASLYETSGRDEDQGPIMANTFALAKALEGVDLGEYDKRIVSWLACYEPAMVTAICGLIERARQLEPEPGKLAEVRQVLAAFDWEFDDRQYALEHIERIVTGGDQ